MDDDLFTEKSSQQDQCFFSEDEVGRESSIMTEIFTEMVENWLENNGAKIVTEVIRSRPKYTRQHQTRDGKESCCGTRAICKPFQ